MLDLVENPEDSSSLNASQMWVDCFVSDSFIIIQNQYGECSGIEKPQNRTLRDRDVFTIMSQAKEQTFYEANRNCVVSLLGKVGWQWSISITHFDVDGDMDASGRPVRCRDFVKMYDCKWSSGLPYQ